MRLVQTNPYTWNHTNRKAITRIRATRASQTFETNCFSQVRQQFLSSCSSCPPPASQFPLPATSSISPLYTLTSPSSLPSTSPTRWRVSRPHGFQHYIFLKAMKSMCLQPNPKRVDMSTKWWRAASHSSKNLDRDSLPRALLLLPAQPATCATGTPGIFI